MAIADRIEKALSDLQARDFENSLIQISIAIDATGKRIRSQSGVGERCREFIMANEDFIYHFAMGGRLKIFPGAIFKLGKGGDLGQILYKSVRCALLHEGDISKTVEFASGFSIGHKDEKFIITENMMYGLIFAVVASPVNVKERSRRNIHLTYNGSPVHINELWGRLDLIKRLVGYQEPHAFTRPNNSLKPTVPDEPAA